MLFCNGKRYNRKKVSEDYFEERFCKFILYFQPFQILKWRKIL